jgi:CheY-like chemotaxis protein
MAPQAERPLRRMRVKFCMAGDTRIAPASFYTTIKAVELKSLDHERKAKMPEILLAEDNPADVYLIREALREHRVDCSVRVATDGQQVLDLLSASESDPEPHGPALIILDLNLPRHDGIEILQRLRETADLRHVPVVVLTSSDSPRDRLAANRLGVTKFLRKPSNLEQFLSLGAVFKQLLEQTTSGTQFFETST